MNLRVAWGFIRCAILGVSPRVEQVVRGRLSEMLEIESVIYAIVVLVIVLLCRGRLGTPQQFHDRFS